MLEILALISMGKRIGSIMREKGRSAGLYQLLLVILWFGGEIVGAVLGVIVTPRESSLAIYVFALVGAIIGAIIAFGIAKSATPDMNALQSQLALGVTQAPINPNQARILPGTQKDSWVCSICSGFIRQDATFCKHCKAAF